MLIRIGAVIVTVVCGLAVGDEVLSITSDARQLTVRYADLGNATKVLANHTLTVGKNGSIDFIAGGETNSRSEEKTMQFGTQITGRLVPADHGSYHLSISLKLGNPIVSEDSATQIVRSECLELRTLMKAGQDAKLSCGGNRWLELRIDD